MARRYFLESLPAPGRLPLPPDLAHHLGTVLRVRAGKVIVLCDGRGSSAQATIAVVDHGEVEVDVEPAATAARTGREVHLAVALPKGTRADWLFEHGTELGVASFQPLLSSRSARTGERTDRWHRICVAAAGQCDRAFVPQVHEPRDLLEWLGAALPDARFVADRAAPPLARMAPSRGPAVLLVGPEGGLAEPELAAATGHGFVPVSLGPYVLRTETAAAIGAALLIAMPG